MHQSITHLLGRVFSRGCLFSMFAGVGIFGAACGGENSVPPSSQAPTQVAACLTFVLEDLPPPNMNAYDRQVIEAVRQAVTAELVAAGFAIVDSRAKPFDVVLKLTATPPSRIETDAKLTGKFSVEGTNGPLDTVEASAPKDAPGAAEAVAAALVDGLFRSGNLGGYIKQLRRPGSSGLARTSLRNMTPACEGFVVTSPTASASASAVATAAPVATVVPEAKPAEPEILVGSPRMDAYAIVFGVEQYKSGASVPGARVDAERMARLMTRTLGVPDAHVKTAFDQKADRLAIDLNLEWLKLNVQKGGRVYFYFAGAGYAGSAPGYPALMPFDADAKTGAKAVTIAALTKGLSETKADESIVIVDAGFGGMSGGRSMPLDTPLLSVKGMTPAVRTAFLSAVTGAEGARGDANGGAFTHFLIEGVGRGRADTNADGRVTLMETVSWVSARVARAAKRDGKAQTPSLSLGPALLPVDKLAVVSGLETP